MMEVSHHGRASFRTQADALLRKNIAIQKRNLRTNIGIIAFPFLLCVLIVVIQRVVNNELDKPKYKCGCSCVDTTAVGSCENVCGIQYSTLDQAASCPISNPPAWPPLLQVPRPEDRATRTEYSSFMELPDESCKLTQSCPATIMFTGDNQSLAESLAGNFFTSASPLNLSDLSTLSNLLLGTDTDSRLTEFIEPAFSSSRPIYIVQPQCPPDSTIAIPFKIATVMLQQEVTCLQGLLLWLNSSSEINDQLFKGYQQGNTERKSNEIIAAYDFLNSNESSLNVIIWYNSTHNNKIGNGPPALVRVPRSLNVASNAYLEFLRGSGVKIQFDFVKEMPKSATQIKLDFSSLLGALFFTWVVELLFPIILTYLVYEKQRNLKIMMKMHGLGDGPYWIISYAYFFCLSSFYMICFVLFGSLIGLKFFTLNDYGVQFVFYFIFINLQIALAFLLASVFSDARTATVVGYIYVFGSGLLGSFLFQFFVQDKSFPRGWIWVMEIVPGFSLYRGLYEFAQYSFLGNYMGTSGISWASLNDKENGMKEVLIIMTMEWFVLLPVAYYLDQVTPLGGGVRKSPHFFLSLFRKKPSSSIQRPILQRGGSKVVVQMDKPDVTREKELVEQLLSGLNTRHTIICDNLKKVYPGRDGNPVKLAVRGLSLAVLRGECFGMLGPNGAGKTSFINMMIGLIRPTSGTAYIQRLDIQTDMDEIYTKMGVCPQHDLLWEMLTGREHLLFYGRLKNLKGDALMQAVEASLKSVNLFHGGVGNKQVRQYSGGMKRRLSVAISLIGDPKVVYMDEPSTGLDPASRKNLWEVVKRAKQGRAIILTTHSMEEAEVLCDRLGIFVDGSLQCIGNPKELKARYGGSFVFTMTTSPNEEHEVEKLAHQFSPRANKIYHIAGTQKFELPKQEVKIAEVFRAVEDAKAKMTVHAWGLADTTLEDVFIKVTGTSSSNFLL